MYSSYGDENDILKYVSFSKATNSNSDMRANIQVQADSKKTAYPELETVSHTEGISAIEDSITVHH